MFVGCLSQYPELNYDMRIKFITEVGKNRHCDNPSLKMDDIRSVLCNLHKPVRKQEIEQKNPLPNHLESQFFGV